MASPSSQDATPPPCPCNTACDCNKENVPPCTTCCIPMVPYKHTFSCGTGADWGCSSEKSSWQPDHPITALPPPEPPLASKIRAAHEVPPEMSIPLAPRIPSATLGEQDAPPNFMDNTKTPNFNFVTVRTAPIPIHVPDLEPEIPEVKWPDLTRVYGGPQYGLTLPKIQQLGKNKEVRWTIVYPDATILCYTESDMCFVPQARFPLRTYCIQVGAVNQVHVTTNVHMRVSVRANQQVCVSHYLRVENVWLEEMANGMSFLCWKRREHNKVDRQLISPMIEYDIREPKQRETTV